MDTEIKSAISGFIKKALETHDAQVAVLFMQAANDAANALCSLKHAEALARGNE